MLQLYICILNLAHWIHWYLHSNSPSMIYNPHILVTNDFIWCKIWYMYGRFAYVVPWYSLFKSITFLAIILFTEVGLLVGPDYTYIWSSSLWDLSFMYCITSNCFTIIHYTILPFSDILIALWFLWDKFGLWSLHVWYLIAHCRIFTTSDYIRLFDNQHLSTHSQVTYGQRIALG